MGKATKTDFATNLLEKLEVWADTKRWTLADAFWLMHLDFNIFLNYMERPTVKASNSRIQNPHQIMTDLNSNLLAYYSEKFERDFSSYVDKILDDIFTDIALHKIPESLPRMQAIPPNHLYSEICALIENLQQFHDNIEAHAEDFSRITTHPNHPIVLPSDIPKVLRMLQKGSNDIEKAEQEKLRQLIEPVARNIDGLRSALRDLVLQKTDDEYQDAIDFCKQNLSDFSHWQEYVINSMTSLEYALDGSFNRELILLFLYGSYDSSLAGEAMQCIIEKQENFFLSIYKTLVSASPIAKEILHARMDYCPREIADAYYHPLPPFIPTDDKRPLLFSLKKLIALYRFYADSSKQPMVECVKYALNSYNYILKETRFDEPSYSPMLDDLPSYVLNTFGLTQSDLARILGVEAYTITREKKSNALVQNHQWFWTAATHFTYTYMLGETTIPDYGKLDPDSNVYGIGVMGQMAYAELFLRYVEDLSEYRKKLQTSELSSKSRYVLDRKYIQQISQNVIQFMETIQKSREALDALCAWQMSIKNNRTNELKKVEDELKEIQSAPNTIKNQKRQFEIQGQHQLMKKEILRATAIFNKASQNFQNFLEYKGKLLSIWSCDYLQKFLSDFEEANRDIERAKQKLNDCDDMDEARHSLTEAEAKYEELWQKLETRIDEQARRWTSIKEQLGKIK